MNRIVSSGVRRGIRSRLAQPVRNYWISAGTPDSATGGSFLKLMKMTGEHGAEFYVLMVMQGVAGFLCIYHCLWDSWYKKPEVAHWTHTTQEEWLRRHDLGFNWNNPIAQRMMITLGKGTLANYGIVCTKYTV